MTIENSSEISKEQLQKEVSEWEHVEGNKGQVYTRPEVVQCIECEYELNFCYRVWSLY